MDKEWFWQQEVVGHLVDIAGYLEEISGKLDQLLVLGGNNAERTTAQANRSATDPEQDGATDQ